MKRNLLTILVVVLLYFAVPKTAKADNGPHGTGYTATTDACAGCHRAHTAVAAGLLTQTTVSLCNTCHSGTGANTNVTSGILVGSNALKSGGFTNARMDTNRDGTSASALTTSTHAIDASAGTMWGSGAIGSGAGVSSNLGCGNCHDPHGKANAGAATYRILRPVPRSSGASTGVVVDDETTKVYTVANVNNDYFNDSYGTRMAPLSNWCAQCHTRYAAAAGSEGTSSGDPLLMYRHRSNTSTVGCMSCHVAHGTSAVMGTNSGAVPWPGGGTTPNGNARSSLLRVDNRGVCQGCHNK